MVMTHRWKMRWWWCVWSRDRVVGVPELIVTVFYVGWFSHVYEAIILEQTPARQTWQSFDGRERKGWRGGGYRAYLMTKMTKEKKGLRKSPSGYV